MASVAGAGVLEKVESKRYFDDTVPLFASILTHRVLSSYAVSAQLSWPLYY